MSHPAIFLSAATKDFDESFIKELSDIIHYKYKCVCHNRYNLAQGGDILPKKLERKIKESHYVIHLVGPSFGSGPADVPSPNPDDPSGHDYWQKPCKAWWPKDLSDLPFPKRRSYTQMEFDFAKKWNRRIWVFLVGEAPDPGSLAEGKDREEADLQRRHRQAIEELGHERQRCVDNAKVIAAFHEASLWSVRFAEARAEFERREKSTRKLILGLAIPGLLLLLAIAYGFWNFVAVQKSDATHFKAVLRENSERRRDAALAAAEGAAGSGERRRLREIAEADHNARLAGIDDAAARLVDSQNGPGATPIGREMTRILAEEGTDPALAYIAGEKTRLLAQVEAQVAADLKLRRIRLAPILSAADLQASKGNTSDARETYRQLLQLDPTWPDAVQAFGWFLVFQAEHSLLHRTLTAALEDATKAHELAAGWHEATPDGPEARRLLATTHDVMGQVRSARGRPGDADEILKHHTRSLELFRSLLDGRSDPEPGQRGWAVSLERLGDFLARRGQPGDNEKAFDHYTNCLRQREELQRAHPSKPLYQRDLAVSLERLADFYRLRGLAGDADLGLRYAERSLEIRERMLEANTNSIEAKSDLAVSLEALTRHRAGRSQSGNPQRILSLHTRSLEIREGMLKAHPDSAAAARLVSSSLMSFGNWLLDRGQSGDAGRAYGYLTRGLALLEPLRVANPDSARDCRGACLAMEGLADFLNLRDQPGDADAGLRLLTRCLEIRQRLLEADLESAAARRDVCQSLSRLGWYHLRRNLPGDEEKAFDHFTNVVEQSEGLLRANTHSSTAKLDVTTSLRALAEFLLHRGHAGDLETALVHLERGRRLAEGVLEADPGFPWAVRELSDTLAVAGAVLNQRGLPDDLQKALVYHGRSLELQERRLTNDPASTEARRAVLARLDVLGKLLAEHELEGSDHGDNFLGHLTRSNQLCEQALKDDPGSAQTLHDACVSLLLLGSWMGSRDPLGEADKALDHLLRADDLAERLWFMDPTSGDMVWRSLVASGDFLLRRDQPGDGEEAYGFFSRSLARVERWLEMEPESEPAVAYLVLSHERLARSCLQREDASGEERHSRAGYELLHPRFAMFASSAPTMAALHARWQARFGVKEAAPRKIEER